jgi:polyhydroxybutyrate depolymerase
MIFKYFFLLVNLVIVSVFIMGCSPSSSGSGSLPEPVSPQPPIEVPNEPRAGLNEKIFWLEPGQNTTIGSGQSINLFSAFKNQSTDPYPVYLPATEIAWTNSQPAVANLSTSGVVTGLSEGSTIITATYKGYKEEITIQVSGAMINRTISVVGQGTRKYSIYIPKFNTSPATHPVLLSLHGGGGTGMMQASVSQLNELASSLKFYVVYPEGSGVIQTFNAGACCGSAQTNNVNDSLFIRTLINDIENRFSVDASKIFATGFSNGGLMSHRLACELADKISGIAPIAGGSGEFDFQNNRYYNCQPSRPIPVLHIHTTNDRNYEFGGGSGNGVSGTDFYPIPNTIDDWIKRNNLKSNYSTETVTATTICYHYKTVSDSAKPSAPVTLCKVQPIDVYDSINEIVFGGGHSWPGGVKSPSSNSDVPDKTFKASQYLWKYLNP